MFTVSEIVSATKGKILSGPKENTAKSVSTDSRAIQPGDLFIALKGDKFDGHDFLDRVITQKAAILVVSKKVSILNPHVTVIYVQDTRKALGLLANFHRQRFHIPVIAITGSAGKTTTKEMMASVLSRRYKVLKNIATENNDIGVPTTLLKLDKTHEIAVIELGTNHFGEIRWLTQVCCPTVSVMINIGESHLEFFKNLSGVFKEKFDIVRQMKGQGTVIFNEDDRFLQRIPTKKLPHRFISFSLQKKSDFQAQNILVQGNSLTFKINRKTFQIQAPIWHNIYNALAAISCARLFNVSWVEIQKALMAFEFPKGRQVFCQIGQSLLIDDTYNANPMSFKSAITTLARLKRPGRKIIICGDMLELGVTSAKLHRQIGQHIRKIHPDLVFSFGNFSKLIIEELQKDPSFDAFYCETSEDLHQKLKELLNKNDTVLIKGSRGMHLEKTVEFLKEFLKR